ncbi:multifunctional oxoglutarate decarboxylase/oxoglutarate dehydrogenase thiamine pyrophosphate-binding subunit/dihydrolipoyllysine-residue succinyltransferase subunit [Streptomyces sp. NBC_01497]
MAQSDFGINEWVVDELRERFRNDPDSVDDAWAAYFSVGGAAAPAALSSVPAGQGAADGSRPPDRPRDLDAGSVTKAIRVAALVHAFRVRGHLAAATDPLSVVPRDQHPDLGPAGHGLDEDDLDREFPVDGFAGRDTMTVREVLATLDAFYRGSVGVEYMHIQDPEERRWIQRRIETAHPRPDRREQLRILSRLGSAEAFETFLQTKYVGQKRYSLEGGESAIVLLDALLAGAMDLGMREVVLGMSHRGRLNVLANVVGKSYAQMFQEFDDAAGILTVQGSGDVKYHLGAAGTYTGPDGRTIPVSVVANPSHLEIVGPVAEGIVRAKQDVAQGAGEDDFPILPVVVHGDAAFAGQGVVAETLNMSQLSGYRTGGTVHVVVNNQVGFTTLPDSGRSSVHATDVARTVEAPILHVNGDDPEAVVRVARLAFDYRASFRKDIVIDLICYRRHGHSEVDDPSITQPAMYDRIAALPSVRKVYAGTLLGRGDVDEDEVEQAQREYRGRLEAAFAATRELAVEEREHTPAPVPVIDGPPPVTAVDEATARRVLATQTDLPEGFTVHPRVLPQLTRRASMLDDGTVDWATAEALAIGSLLLDGVPVRLTGEDVRRGTFGQRHAVLTDRRTGAEHTPLGTLGDDAAPFMPYDSLLSELGALAFEYGYSLGRPDALVLWEAQFGDFVNGAQTVIDEYISSAEQKWGQSCGVSLLLPHGLEGQGPDHSSARVERFLQMCAENNMTVAVPSLPANYFHLLRQQGGVGLRRPLVVFTPKSMLRLKTAVSPLGDFTEGGFRPVLVDPVADPARVRRVLLCSGKIAHELAAHRADSGAAGTESTDGTETADGTAIVRLEQLYPFPDTALRAELSRFPAGVPLRWVQEEPANQGAWSYVGPRLRGLAQGALECVSRPPASAPAVGSARRHGAEQRDVVRRAFA